MSDPGKKDDHAKKDYHGHVPAKKTLVQTLIGVALGGLAVYLFLVFMGTFLAPSIVSAVGDGLGLTGNAFDIASAGLRTLNAKFRNFMITAIGYAITLVIGFYIFKYLKELLFPAKKDDGHGH